MINRIRFSATLAICLCSLTAACANSAQTPITFHSDLSLVLAKPADTFKSLEKAKKES